MIMQKTKTSECTPLLILSCLGSTIGTTVPVGYLLGVVNAPAQFVQEWMEAVFKNRGVSMDSAVKIEVLWAVIIAIYLVGGMIGSFVAAWYSDTFGRKGCILFSAILLLVAAMLMGFCRACNMVEMLFVGRLIAGIGSALIFTAQPMYLAELAPDSLRSIFGVFTCLGVTFGALIGALVSMPQLLGSSEHWPLAFSFYAIFIIIGFLPGYWYPESPRWLYVIKNNDIKALLVLERLRRTRAQVDMELNEMRTESQMYVKNENWITICKRKELLLPFVLVCSLQACQQMTGINAIFFYSISTFTGAGFSLTDAAFMNLGLSVFNLFAALFGSFFVHLYDRRRMLIISFSGLGCSLTGISFSLHYVNLFAWMPSVPIIFMATFVASFQLGIAQISYFIGSELFDVTPRPFAMSFGSFCNWFGNTLIGFCFPLLQHAIGSFAFMPCVLVCIYGICLVYFYLPETRGRDLTTIKQSMAKGAQRRCCGRKSSSIVSNAS